MRTTLRPSLPVKRGASLRNGVVIAGACVAAGIATIPAVLHPLETPGRVAERFANALYSEDWSTVWETMCQSTRDIHESYNEFADGQDGALEDAGLPSDLTARALGTRAVRRTSGPAFLVELLLISKSQDETQRAEFPVVFEDDHLRVCFA